MSTRGASVPRCFMCCHFGDSTVKQDEGCNEWDGDGEIQKERGKKSDDWRDEWGIEVHNICFLAFPLQVMPLADEAFAFSLTLSPALNFSSRSCSFFRLWAHFMEKLVNIDEGHIGSFFNWGQDRRGKKAGIKMGPTCGFIPSWEVQCICVFFLSVSKCLCHWLHLYVFKCWHIYLTAAKTPARKHYHFIS